MSNDDTSESREWTLVVCPNHGAQTCGCYRCDDWKVRPVVPREDAEALVTALEAIRTEARIHWRTGYVEMAEAALARYRAAHPGPEPREETQ